MKRILSTLLIFVLLISAVPISLTASANTTDFAGGSGTENDPYLISTKAHLNKVRYYLNAHFKMTADIEFADEDFAEGGDFYNDGQGWASIGTDSYTAFTGTFDGDGHTIKNLYTFSVRAGLFGYSHGTIKNLGMVVGTMSASVTSSRTIDAYASGIAKSNSGTIENCYNTGEVSATATFGSSVAYAGGIAGYNDGTIKNCYNTGEVSATVSSTSSIPYAYTGGIVGYNEKGTITNCHNTGKVSATSSEAYVGGIVGNNTEGTIDNCYNTGEVSATASSTSSNSHAHAGGIVGYNEKGTITNCHNTGEVSATASSTSSNSYAYAGGVVGYNTKGTIDNGYNTGTVLSTATSSSSSSFFAHAGGIVGKNYGYNGEGTITNCHNTGKVSSTSTATSSSSSSSCNAGGIVGDNWDSTIKNCYNIGEVAASASSEAYAGGIVGENYNNIIENCYNIGEVSATASSTSSNSHARAGGVVGNNTKGTITNCHNTGKVSATSSDVYAGGIVGNNTEGTIDNCYNTGEVEASASSEACVGGIVSANSYSGTIKNCYNTGKVSATSAAAYSHAHAGGITGSNSGTIENCYNTGTISASSVHSSAYAGGIAGSGYSESTITNCYNTGNVAASSSSYSLYDYAQAGGIVGYNMRTIKNCYNTGKVSATSAAAYSHAHAGGIVGENYDNIIENCYYIDTISKGVDEGTDTTTKCTAEQLKLQPTFVGFEFEDIWTMGGSNCYLYPEHKDVEFVGHIYESTCDTTCACGYVRTITHDYKIEYNSTNHWQKCSVCHDTIDEKAHEFNNACDTDCDCGYTRTISHNYQATFDTGNHFDKCSVCGDVINSKPHVFDNACDTDCACGYERTITHSYGEYVYNNDATTKKDGTKTRTCSVCGNTETVTATGTKLQTKNPFTDVKKSDFYYTPVLWAVENGITSGTSKTTFSPKDACTRGQIATFLWRAAGQPTPKTSKNPFTDVKKSDYYYKAVLWAVGEGITSGTSKTTFGPNEACTRGQIATFLWRAAGSPKPTTTKNPFTDVKTKDFYYKAVLWAVENGITAGTSKTTFEPGSPCTRGQIATFLYRAYN